MIGLSLIISLTDTAPVGFGLACGIPPVVMSDSPKNREYVEESGFGVVAEPDVDSIRKAIIEAKKQDPQKGIDYVTNKWTSQHYADNIMIGINRVLDPK